MHVSKKPKNQKIKKSLKIKKNFKNKKNVPKILVQFLLINASSAKVVNISFGHFPVE
jgi:hypothetical protein